MAGRFFLASRIKTTAWTNSLRLSSVLLGADRPLKAHSNVGPPNNPTIADAGSDRSSRPVTGAPRRSVRVSYLLSFLRVYFKLLLFPFLVLICALLMGMNLKPDRLIDLVNKL